VLKEAFKPCSKINWTCFRISY